MKRQPDHHGFTLVELLIVVAILGLLMGILVPSLGQARRQARRAQCATKLRDIFLATTMYVGDYGKFPALNNEVEEGAWQYNYLIWDGHNYDNNFGPLAKPESDFVPYIQQLFCPVQLNPYHRLGTSVNPWPVRPIFDTRAGYARRYGLSGKSLTQVLDMVAVMADVLHIPEVVLESHQTGVNAVYSDGHVVWVQDRLLVDNDLTKPFRPEDNDIVRDIWKRLDEKGR